MGLEQISFIFTQVVEVLFASLQSKPVDLNFSLFVDLRFAAILLAKNKQLICNLCAWPGKSCQKTTTPNYHKKSNYKKKKLLLKFQKLEFLSIGNFKVKYLQNYAELSKVC